MDLARNKRIGSSLAKFAEDNGSNYFATLKPGVHGLSSYNLDRELRPTVGRFICEFARLREVLPWRKAVEGRHLPFLVGVAELYGRAGNIDPHFHFMINLRDGEEVQFRGLARTRWGVDMTVGAKSLVAALPPKNTPSYTQEYLYPEPVSADPDPRRWLIADRRYSPSFDLQPIRSDPDRIGRYITKQFPDPLIWTHLELFDNAKPPKNRQKQNPSKVRA